MFWLNFKRTGWIAGTSSMEFSPHVWRPLWTPSGVKKKQLERGNRSWWLINHSRYKTKEISLFFWERNSIKRLFKFMEKNQQNSIFVGWNLFRTITGTASRQSVTCLVYAWANSNKGNKKISSGQEKSFFLYMEQMSKKSHHSDGK